VPSPTKRSAQTGQRATPQARVIVLPWLKSVGQRFIMPSWLAITIRSWIFAWRDLDEAEMAHELVHVRQWHEHGFLNYILRYMSASSRAKKEGGDRYRDNPFEAEAREAEEAVRRRKEDR
jgi:hypothetical protein